MQHIYEDEGETKYLTHAIFTTYSYVCRYRYTLFE